MGEFKPGNMVCLKFEELCNQKERKDYIYSGHVLTESDIRRGWYKTNPFNEPVRTYNLNECVLIEDSVNMWPKGYLSRDVASNNRTLVIGVKKILQIREERPLFAPEDDCKILFKGVKVNARGMVKDNMFYFEAFGYCYKTKVYLTKEGEWRSVCL